MQTKPKLVTSFFWSVGCVVGLSATVMLGFLFSQRAYFENFIEALGCQLDSMRSNQDYLPPNKRSTLFQLENTNTTILCTQFDTNWTFSCIGNITEACAKALKIQGNSDLNTTSVCDNATLCDTAFNTARATANSNIDIVLNVAAAVTGFLIVVHTCLYVNNCRKSQYETIPEAHTPRTAICC